jgi:hypothetical protein
MTPSLCGTCAWMREVARAVSQVGDGSALQSQKRRQSAYGRSAPQAEAAQAESRSYAQPGVRPAEAAGCSGSRSRHSRSRRSWRHSCNWGRSSWRHSCNTTCGLYFAGPDAGIATWRHQGAARVSPFSHFQILTGGLGADDFIFFSQIPEDGDPRLLTSAANSTQIQGRAEDRVYFYRPLPLDVREGR